MDDDRLIKQFQAGDHEAFRQIVEQFGDELYRIGVTLTHNAATAQDVVQETLLQAWTRRDQLRSPDKFRSWLFAILRNSVHDYARHKSRREFTSPDTSTLFEQHELNRAARPLPPDELVLQSEFRRQMADALATLSPSDQQILALRFQSDLDIAEIAQLLAIRSVTTRSKLHRALRRLGARFPDLHSSETTWGDRRNER